MFPFVVLLILVIILSFGIGAVRSSDSSAALILAFSFAALVIFAGMRDRYVGGDTRIYVGYFYATPTFADTMEKIHTSGDPAYWILSWVAHQISDQYLALLFCIAIPIVGMYLVSIVQYSCDWGVSLFLYVATTLYLFSLNGARQALACAVYALAIGSLRERRIFKHAAYVLVASLFHKSVLLMLGAYFLLKNRCTLKHSALMGTMGLLMALAYRKFVNIGAELLDERLGAYAEVGEGGGVLTTAVWIITTLFFAAIRPKIREDLESYDLYLNMLIVGAVLAAVAVSSRSNPSGFLRVRFYFTPAELLLWPVVFKNMEPGAGRSIVKFLFFVFYIASYLVQVKALDIFYEINREFLQQTSI